MRGLCVAHANATKYFWEQHDDTCGETCPHKPDGRLFDLLGLRLNVLQETGGACLRSGGCVGPICRFHLDDGQRHMHSRARPNTQTCAIRLAGNGGMTLEDIGAATGRTRERVRQLEAKALRGLSEGLAAQGLKTSDIAEVIDTRFAVRPTSEAA